jgi:LysM repeat protein
MKKCHLKFLFEVLAVFILLISLNGNVSAHNLNLPNSYTAYDVIGAVNALRASHGLSAYSANSILMGTAQAQANYMAATGTVTHYGANGSLPYQRALAAGYSVENAISNPPGFFSENIEGGPDLTPDAVVKAWQGDSPHLLTMLSPNLQDIGAGIAVAGGFYYYVIDCGLSGGAPISYTPSVNGTPASPSQLIAAAVVSTPDQAGNVYHVVLPGQSLWQIAIAYKVKINDIRQLNPSVGADNVIQAGQKLLIMKIGTATSLPPTPQPALDLSTITPLPTLAVITETPSSTATPIPTAPAQSQNRTLIVGGIILVALISAGLVGWLGRNRPI